MIAGEIAGQLLSGVPQDVQAGVGSSQAETDFLPLFERVLGIGVAGQATDGAALEDLIGMSDASADEADRAVGQGSSGIRDEKSQAGRGVDPALAILMAALSQPQQGSSLEPTPGLDRLVDLQTPAMAAAPPVETTPPGVVLPPPFPPQGARPTPEPVALLAGAQLADSPAPIPGKIVTLLTPGAAGQGAETPAIASGLTLTPPGPGVMAQPPDVGRSDPRRVTEPVKALQVDLEAVQIELPEPTPGLDRLVDLQTPAMAAAPPVETTPPGVVLPPPFPPQGARPTPEPVALLAGAQLADSPAPIPGKIVTLLTPGAAAITTSSVQPESLNGNASTHAGPDLSKEGGAASTTPGRVSLSPLPRPSAVNQGAEPPVISDQQSASGGARPPMTGVKEVQEGISRSNGDQAPEEVGGLPPMVTSVEGPARTLVTSSEETAGRSSLPQHSAGRIATTSGPVEGPGPEVFEGEESPERGQVGRADSDRVVIRPGSPRPETTQGMQQNGSASDSEGGSRSSDRSSSPPDNARQFGPDLALAAPPRGEELRSGSAVPSLHSRELFDQVAKQVATAARLSLRNEGGHVQLRLHPQALGELVIEVSWQDSGIVAAIKAQSRVAGDLLAGDLGRLRTALGEQGIPVSGLGVQVGLDLRHWSFEGNGFRASPTIGYAREAIPWRERNAVLPMIPAMEPDRLIDITV